MPRPTGGIQAVVIAEELVLLDGWRAATVLNATGALIWDAFDGRVSIDEIAHRLASEHHAPLSDVLGDALNVARNVGAVGLLEGVSPPTDMVVTAEPMKAMAVGDLVVELTLSDLDGAPHSLSGLADNEMCLVKWNPHCGYCARIAGRLADLQSALEARGVALVLVADGDEKANRLVAETAGLHVPILLRTGEVDPFGGAGTPAAFHLDPSRRLLSTPAYGFEEVVAMVEQLAGVEPTSTQPTGANAGSDSPVRYLLDRGVMCVPGVGTSACTTWVGTRVYEVNAFHVGIRYDDEATTHTLDRLFAGHRVDDPRAGHSFSVALNLATQDQTDLAGNENRQRRLALLAETGHATLRSRDPARVLRALLWRLAEETNESNCPAGFIRANAIAVVTDEGAALLPVNFQAFAPRLQPMLARAGISVIDVTRPEIDIATGELVVREPAVDYDRSVIDEVAQAIGATTLERPPVPPGRYRLIGWCTIHPADRPVVHLSTASAAAATMSSVAGSSDPRTRLFQLADLFTRVPGYGLWYHSEPELIHAISSALR